MTTLRFTGTRLCLCMVLASSLAACFGTSSPRSEGGQTHWLSDCAADAECGELQCICGTCTLPCRSNGGCRTAAAPTAVCVAASEVEATASCGEVAPGDGVCAPATLSGDGAFQSDTGGAGAASALGDGAPLTVSESCPSITGPAELVVEGAAGWVLSDGSLYYLRDVNQIAELWQANPDGTAAKRLASVPGAPHNLWDVGGRLYLDVHVGIGLEPSMLYAWDDTGTPLIGEFEFDVVDLAADDAYLYVAGMRQDLEPAYINLSVVAPEDGASVEFQRSEGYYWEQTGGRFAIDEARLYFAEDPNGMVAGDGAILHQPKGAPGPLATLHGAQSSPRAPQLAGGDLYWLTAGSMDGVGLPRDDAAIMRAPGVDGTPETVIGNLPGIDAFVVDGAQVYLLVNVREGGGTLQRAPLDGSQPPTVLAQHNSIASGPLRADGDFVYWHQRCDAATGGLVRIQR